MLTHDQIRDALARFSYKPNVTFDLTLDDDRLIFHTEMWVENSREQIRPWELKLQQDYWEFPFSMARTLLMEPDRHLSPERPVIRVAGTKIVPDLEDEDALWQWLRLTLRELEMHELDEWFKVDGELLWDPHQGQR